MSGTIKKVTTNYNLRIPIFDAPGWGKEMERNFDIIDALVFAVAGISNVVGVWTNGTPYALNDRAVDPEDNSLWICEVIHTSPSTGTFTEHRVAQPTYWERVASTFRNRGMWVTGTEYVYNDFVEFAGGYGVVVVDNFISGASYAADVLAGKIATLADFNPYLNAAAASAASALASENSATASATTATTQAGNATTKASEALTSANNADADRITVAADKAIVAADKATVASDKAITITNKNDAVTARIATEAARDAALAAFDNFDDRYLGNKAADPTTDNDGNALVAGTLYFSTTLGYLRIYTGTVWTAAYVVGTDVLLKAQNLADLANAVTARTNLGLGNVNNTSDINKPISTAQQAALDLKATVSALAAEAALARNASSLNTGTVPDGVLRDGTKSLATVLVAPFDVDTLKTNGRYYSSGLIIPGLGAFYGFIEVIFVDGGYGRHEYHYFNSEGASYVRYCVANVWGSIKKLQVTQGEQDARYAQMGAPNMFSQNAAYAIGKSVQFYTADYGIGTPASIGLQIYCANSDQIRLGKMSSGIFTDVMTIGVDNVPRIGTNPIHHDGNASRYGAPDAVLQDQKAQNTAAQALTAGTWTVRNINTEVRDPFGLVSLSSNQMTFTVAGWVEWETVGSSMGQTQLWNVTDGVAAGLGISTNTGMMVGGAPVIAGKVYELRHNQNTTAVAGAARNVGVEVYTHIKFWRS